MQIIDYIVIFLYIAGLVFFLIRRVEKTQQESI